MNDVLVELCNIIRACTFTPAQSPTEPRRGAEFIARRHPIPGLRVRPDRYDATSFEFAAGRRKFARPRLFVDSLWVAVVGCSRSYQLWGCWHQFKSISVLYIKCAFDENPLRVIWITRRAIANAKNSSTVSDKSPIAASPVCFAVMS